MTDLMSCLQYWAESCPDKIAFSMHKKENITYQQLYKKSIKLAIYLKKKQLKPADFVVIALPTSIECIIAYFACFAAGICFIPVYPPKNIYDTLRLKSVMSFTCAPYVIVEKEGIKDHLDSDYPFTLESIELVIHSSETLPDEEFVPYVWEEKELCLLQYSSGSTHQPKGVEILHGNLMASLEMMQHAMQLTPQDKGCSWLPPYHDMGLIGSIFLPIYVGFPIHLLSSKTFAARPMLWLEIISQERCSITSAPNFAYDICAHRASSFPLKLDLSCLRIAINGSEFIRPTTLHKFIEVFSPYGFKALAMKPVYGLAESTLMVSYTDKEYIAHTFDRNSLHQGIATLNTDNNLETEGIKLISCGRAIKGVDIQIVDRETQTLRPPFHVGEIWVKSPSNAKGYFGNLEQTKKNFRQQVASLIQAKEYLRTGDTGFMDFQGNLYITGRQKDYINKYGLNIAAEEIEDIILNTLSNEGIDPTFRCAALCLYQASYEQLIILQEIPTFFDQKKLEKNIIMAIKRSFSLSPEKIIFLKRGTIPRTTSGKIKRHAALVLYQYNVLKDI